MGKIPLFHESDQEDDGEQIEFKTNKSYAKHYDEFRKKEVLGQLKNLESEGESSSSEDETTDEEVVDPEFDKEFFRTLAYLKRRDPAKYEEKPQFFENVKPVEEVALEKRKKKEKPMTLKDYERKVILEKGGVYEDEDENPRQQARPESPSLVQQQEQIKDEIKRALSRIDTDDEDEDEGKGGLLKERSKSKEEKERDQANYLSWLADKKSKEAPTEEVKPLEPLKEFWSSKSLSKEDAFLKDYILNKRFVDSSGEVPTYDDIVATSEDEEELEKQEEYERQYNFRFEEPDAEFIKRYPRNVEESVRIERNKRKEQRQALKERKQREKEQQKRELEELKAIKLQEIKDRIQKLKEIAATENMNINEEELESDFDPEEHDRRMQRMFDEDYYGVDEGDQKPEFPDLDEELGIENYDREKVDSDEQEKADDDGPYCEDDDFVMDADYEENQKKKQDKKNLEEELLEATGGKKKKKGKKLSKFAEVLKKEKPLFDPEDEKTYGEYIDEYYKLDYEDIIGDTPCRFRYVETVPNDFGLSIEEILMANTRELNRWASVKKTVQIRPKYSELSEIEVYKRKAQNEELKKKLLPSLFKQQERESDEDEEIKQKKVNTITELDVEDSTDNVETAPAEGKKKKKKKKKQVLEQESTRDEQPKAVPETTETLDTNKESKKSKKNRKSKEQHLEEPTELNSTEETPPTEDKKGKKRKRDKDEPQTAQESVPHPEKKPKKFNKERKQGHFSASQQAPSNVTDSRLRAFGINPKKFHNKLKYGGGSQSQQAASAGEQHENRHHGQNGKFSHKGGKYKNQHWKNKKRNFGKS
ncbi:protein KRI1 homolog [Aedes albopictus]|uniref:Protein KRI1 homolog n=1 Tax=Aedes albopictus TaxID=7160 RepID=A0ABM1Y6Z9_AEDAL|nr:protein KRI1 homolog [Aedes albopictus]